MSSSSRAAAARGMSLVMPDGVGGTSGRPSSSVRAAPYSSANSTSAKSTSASSPARRAAAADRSSGRGRAKSEWPDLRGPR
jgi:hypothetical protein